MSEVVLPDRVLEMTRLLASGDGLPEELALLSVPERLQRIQVAAILVLLEKVEQLLATKENAAASGGFVPEYFRGLIEERLGQVPDDKTLETLFSLAGDAARLERAITSVEKAMQSRPVDSPVGFLVSTLRRWREQDRQRAA